MLGQRHGTLWPEVTACRDAAGVPSPPARLDPRAGWSHEVRPLCIFPGAAVIKQTVPGHPYVVGGWILVGPEPVGPVSLSQVCPGLRGGRVARRRPCGRRRVARPSAGIASPCVGFFHQSLSEPLIRPLKARKVKDRWRHREDGVPERPGIYADSSPAPKRKEGKRASRPRGVRAFGLCHGIPSGTSCHDKAAVLIIRPRAGRALSGLWRKAPTPRRA